MVKQNRQPNRQPNRKRDSLFKVVQEITQVDKHVISIDPVRNKT